ncbi:MAG: HlyC/CorC family transporter [Nitrosarchaeum sp.]|nr:HlyC/CorC family transporter [Nitrosarchaeum sp.]MBP0120424.1 HlyC/CorC family transporter [Nitrosarchaeum sp.]MBP0134533.1 HlyC/CorC family transporter [Nitrosarchaeum sp.]MDW7642074.1 hemolysin family protein [Nitrosarchaeum sp.]
MVEIWVEYIVLAALIGLSAFFSGVEVAMVGIRKSTVTQLLKDKVKGAKALHKFTSNPSWMMSSVNLGNNLTNVAASVFATSIAIRTFENYGLEIAEGVAVAITVGVMTFMILVFGEITPKIYANANSTKTALRCAPLLLIFSYALWPVVKLFEIITKTIIKLTGSSYQPPPITEEEIKGIVAQGLADNVLEKDESELVHSALEFDDTVIRTVMTPRTKMFTLPAKMLLFEALPLISENLHSRIPIFGETRDDIIGFVHVSDILIHIQKENKMITLEQVSRKPVFASQEKMVSSLLKEMKGRKTHMAIVIDEHGGVEGLVTLEDLIEEIVGDIEDETDDTPSKKFESIDKDTIITNGDIEIKQINEIFKSELPEGDNYASLNGLLHEKLKDIAREGDKLEIDNIRIVIEKVIKNKPEKIRIERIKK